MYLLLVPTVIRRAGKMCLHFINEGPETQEIFNLRSYSSFVAELKVETGFA